MTNTLAVRSERFSREWAGATGAAILIGFGIQPSLPFVANELVLLGAIGFAMLYIGIHDVQVRERGGMSWGMVGIGLVTGLGALIYGATQVSGATAAVAPMCRQLQKELMLKANGDAAETFASLHCQIIAQP